LIGSKSVPSNTDSQREDTQRQGILLQIRGVFDNLRSQIADEWETLSKRFRTWIAEKTATPADSKEPPSVLVRALPVVQKGLAQVRARFAVGTLIFAVLVLLGSGVLAVNYFRQQSSRQAILDSISSVQRTTRRYGTEESRAQSLAEAESMLQANQEYFPVGRTSASVLSEILVLAQETEVEVSNMEAYVSKDPRVDPEKYTVVTVNLQAKGLIDKLEAFLDGLESDQIKAISITRVTMGGVSTSPLVSLSISAFGRK